MEVDKDGTHEELRSILFTRFQKVSCIFCASKDNSDMLTNGLSPVFGGLSVKVWTDVISIHFLDGRVCRCLDLPRVRRSDISCA